MRQDTRRLEEAFRRIKGLASGIKSSVTEEDLAKSAFEYLDGVACMSNAEGLNLQSPFFAAKSLLEGSAVSSDALESEIEHATNGIRNTWVRGICTNYLVWCAAFEDNATLARKYPNLFEPMIRLFEAGGEFGFHKGEFMVGDAASRKHIAIPLGEWKVRAQGSE